MGKSIVGNSFRLVGWCPKWLAFLLEGLLAILTLVTCLGLAAFSMFAVHVVEREVERRFFDEAVGPTGLEYFLGPAILCVLYLGFVKLFEMRLSQKQRGTISDFRLRAFAALKDDVDIDALQRLYGEGLVYRTEWEANIELNETIGALSYVISRKSSRAFIDSLK